MRWGQIEHIRDVGNAEKF